MALISVKSNTNQVMRQLKAKFKTLDKDSGEATAVTAEFGATYMFNVAPKDTKLTAQAIKWTKGKKGGKTATIVIGDGHPERRGLIKGQYGLTYYMNFVSNDLSHWRTGNPHFIDAGVKETKKVFKRKVRRVINAFVK